MDKIIFFDGVCNFCNRSVQFIIRNDRNSVFKFASLQSNYSKQKLVLAKEELGDIDSVVLWDNGKIYVKSTAALKIAQELAGIWKLSYVFMIVPKFIRDAIYDFIAKNRYKWFGRQETCWLPTPALKERFIEN